MFPRCVQSISLRDRYDRDLGLVEIERVERDLVFGLFTPGPDYPQVESLFAQYVEAANDQLLSTIAQLDERISAMGLRLHTADGTTMPEIYDVQIGDGVITFRTCTATDPSLSPDAASLTNLPVDAIRPEAPTG
jgi:hypothetical protein